MALLHKSSCGCADAAMFDVWQRKSNNIASATGSDHAKLNFSTRSKEFNL
jgi:hypothetical protein